MKTEEYAPTATPMNSASARSLSGPAPSSTTPAKRIAPIGSRAMIEVLIERTRVWLTARLTAPLYVMRLPPARPAVFSRTLSKTTTVS